MNQKEKIKTLFYSIDSKNRALAFELAKTIHYYEEFITEIHDLIFEVPKFEADRKYYLEAIKDIAAEEATPVPTGIELKKACIEQFCLDYFYEDINLRAHGENKLTSFPKIFLHCTFIKKLNLGWNDIDKIPDEISRLSNLVELDLSCNNQINKLPDSLGQLQMLEKLILYGIGQVFFNGKDYDTIKNDAVTFSNCIRQMKNLKHLDLGDIWITKLPEWIHELTQLEYLTVFSGAGSYPDLEIPSTITQLPNLKTLQIDAYTSDIPEDIDQLQALECLVIQPARTIPKSIKNLKNLVYLDLSYFSRELKFDAVDGFNDPYDLDDNPIPEGLTRIDIYGWNWLKEMTWLKEFRFVDIAPFAFTAAEIKVLKEALPNCTLNIER